MQAPIIDPRLYSALNWLIIASAIGMVIRLIAKAAIMRGAKLGTALVGIIFAGVTSIISAACAVGAFIKFGAMGLIIWLGLSALCAAYFATKANQRNEPEQWMRTEMAFIDAATAVGWIIGSGVTAAALRYLKIF